MSEQLPAKLPPGRPSLFSLDLAIAICERIASGETLIEICRDPGMPSEVTVRRWDLEDREGFRSMYTRARQLQIEHEVEEIKLIADTPVSGEVHTFKQVPTKGGEVVDVMEVRRSDMIEHRRLQLDARKWRAGKLVAKYNERARWRDEPEVGTDGMPIEVAPPRIIIEGGLPQEGSGGPSGTNPEPPAGGDVPDAPAGGDPPTD